MSRNDVFERAVDWADDIRHDRSRSGSALPYGFQADRLNWAAVLLVLAMSRLHERAFHTLLQMVDPSAK